MLAGQKIWLPQSVPQWRAFLSPAFETLYGGAAGGGKSDLLLGLARLAHGSSLLLRRTYPALEDSLVVRSLEFYGDPNLYNRTRHVWVIDGRRVRFGHLKDDASVQLYKSAQFDLIAFDELTEFTRFQYEYMLSRARTTARGQRVRVVSCSNPGEYGNDWVMRRWAPWLDRTYPNPAGAGELRWFRRDKDGEDRETAADDPDAKSRTFIPALLGDNPYLGEDYRRILAGLPEPYRSQLLYGDWQAGQTDSAFQVIPTAWIQAAMARWTKQRPEGMMDAVGVDVARGGDDQTILARRYGKWFAPLEKHPGHTTPDGPTVAALMATTLTGGGRANVDIIGIGASAYDVANMQGLDVYGVNFGEGTKYRDRSGRLKFLNVRAECYWRLREALDPEHGEGLMLPPDPELLGDLSAPRWEMKLGGVKIESKPDIKERLGRSPDCGDAIALAHYIVPSPMLWFA